MQVCVHFCRVQVCVHFGGQNVCVHVLPQKCFQGGVYTGLRAALKYNVWAQVLPTRCLQGCVFASCLDSGPAPKISPHGYLSRLARMF